MNSPLKIASRVLLAITMSLQAQSLTWTDISAQYELPATIRLFEGSRTTPPLRAWYLDLDLNDSTYVLLPFLSDRPDGKEGVVPFARRAGAIAAINGGYFDTNSSTSFSTVVAFDEVLAQNLKFLNRSGSLYPATRSLFSLDSERQMSIDWVYHFGPAVTDIVFFDEPTANAEGSPPVPEPQRSDGTAFTSLFGAIGGGPTLVKEGTIRVTYEEEVFWSSGVGLAVDNPRTAVGHTADQHAILLVVDGRQSASQGVDLNELAQIMIDLNCVEAMNLDGGGSTQMAVAGRLVNRPEGGTFMRPVPTVLTVIHRDSLPEIPGEGFEQIVDTADLTATIVGDGWFESANPGFWGDTPSLLNNRGNGDRYVEFKLGVIPSGEYDIFAWWVAAFNRCTDTPVIVIHANGRDTIRVDQTTGGSRWNLIGRFDFTGEQSESIVISNAATNGEFVVADAVRALLQEENPTAVDGRKETAVVRTNVLQQNYPNPFNPATRIRFSMAQRAPVKLVVYDLNGRPVVTLVDGVLPAGEHSVAFEAGQLAAGVYWYVLQTGRERQARKMVLLQ